LYTFKVIPNYVVAREARMIAVQELLNAESEFTFKVEFSAPVTKNIDNVC
jgi:hypothetical protein